jgi:hypothetical protein
MLVRTGMRPQNRVRLASTSSPISKMARSNASQQEPVMACHTAVPKH